MSRNSTIAATFDNFALNSELLARTADEMDRQVSLWGQRSHKFLAVEDRVFANGQRMHHNRMSNMHMELNDADATAGTQSWEGIVFEELHEAFSEDDPALAINELVQLAAVALSAARSIEEFGLYGTNS